MGLQPGVYVLIFDGQATRSNWTGLYDDTQFSYRFVCDVHGDPDEAGTAEEPGRCIFLLSLPMVRHLQKNGSHADGVTK